MKTKLCLLPVLAFLCLLTGIQVAETKTVAGSSAFGTDNNGPLSCGDMVIQSALGHTDTTSLVEQDGCYSPVSNEETPPLVRVSDLQPDDDSQAHHAPEGDRVLNLASCRLSSRSAQWQLRQSDAQHANSFIHTKAKPPPPTRTIVGAPCSFCRLLPTVSAGRFGHPRPDTRRAFSEMPSNYVALLSASAFQFSTRSSLRTLPSPDNFDARKNDVEVSCNPGGSATVSLMDWLPASINVFDASDCFRFTNPIAPDRPQEFYRLHLQRTLIPEIKTLNPKTT